MNNKQGNDLEEVRVKKSGIKELLGKIKTLEKEVEKNKNMGAWLAEKELEREAQLKKIKALEEQLLVNKKAFEFFKESRDKEHLVEVNKLKTELSVKTKIVEVFSVDISTVKQHLADKETEIKQLQAELKKARILNSSSENAQKELGKYKQNLNGLQTKHQKVTLELSKYNAVPFLKDILAIKELLSKLESKVAKTKVVPENKQKIEEKRLAYQAELDKSRELNAKLLEGLKGEGDRYSSESLGALESQICELQRKSDAEMESKVRKIYAIALLTSELNDKLNKGIPGVLNEIVVSAKACEDQLNGLGSNTFQQNFSNQEKKYKEALKKLNDENIFLESLARHLPAVIGKKTTTGRAEDLLKATTRDDVASCSSTGTTNESLMDLKEKCVELFSKYYSGDIPRSVDETDAVPTRRVEPTGWNFDFLDEKLKDSDNNN